jgi:hypothetical protein
LDDLIRVLERRFLKTIRPITYASRLSIFETGEGEIEIFKPLQPVVFFDPMVGANRGMKNCWDVNALRTVDDDIGDRYLGENLLAADAIDLSGGAVAGTAFDTEGHHYLLVTYVMGTMATNPTALVCHIELSTDNFDTIAFGLLGRDGVVVTQVMTFADADQNAFFMPTSSNAGVGTATDMHAFPPIPDIAGITMRLVFTPTGAGISNEPMTVAVYGITPR